MKGQVQINYNLYDFEDLKQAVTTLTLTTEKQFEAIKNEKWYTRLFDCITFSNKKEKRLASQVDSLSQAQQILAEMLIMLSKKDAQVALLVSQNFQYIKKLAEKNKRLENELYLIRYNMTRIEDINELSYQCAEILVACLDDLSSIYTFNRKQQEYSRNIINFFKNKKNWDINVEINNLDDVIETLDELSRIIILTCCIECMFLRMDRIIFYLKNRKYIEKFNVGKKTIKKIKNRTKATFRLIGKEGMVSKYLQPSIEDNYKNDLYVDIDDEIESYDEHEEYIGLPLEFIVSKKIKDAIVYFETKDFFVWNTQEGWYCYNKEMDTDVPLLAINSDDISVFKEKKYSIDYNNNVVFYIQDDLLHRIDLLNDVNKTYINNSCDNDIIVLRAQGNYVVMASKYKFYCYDIISETFFEITDGTGKSISDIVSSTKRNVAILGKSIYFSTNSGETLCDKNGANFVDVIIKYNIVNREFTRISCAGIRDVFTSCGEIYIITDKYNNKDDYHCGWRLLKLTEQNGTCKLESIIKYPYDSKTIISENYFVYCSGYSIYAFDFRKQENQKVVEDCYNVVDVGIIRYKPERRNADFRIISNWIYFEKRGDWYRENLNIPLSATKAVEYD